VALAASAELHAPHPIARALLAFASAHGIALTPPEAQESVPGLGVRARVGGVAVAVGQPQLLEEMGSLPAGFHARIAELRARGMTVAAMRAADRVCVLGAADEPRPEAARTIQRLRALGVRHVAMLTGDHRTTADAVAAGLGLDQVEAELASDAKGRAVAALVAKHGRVMMVGDGANDAPSLALAYLGVGMGGLGNEAALAASDVVIVRDSLDVLPDFLRLGRRTTSIIRANLLLAGGMVAGLTIAAFAGVLPMGLAVVGHEGSTVLVILNGLRLLGGPGSGDDVRD
jgi:Cd2+/Zn2+-exporting ATPase